MARFAPVDWCVFGKEVLPSEQRYYLFQAFIGTSKPKFAVPFFWITSARLPLEEKRKIQKYLVNGKT